MRRVDWTLTLHIEHEFVLLPVCVKVCFFMSDFWWNLLPQYWHG